MSAPVQTSLRAALLGAALLSVSLGLSGCGGGGNGPSTPMATATPVPTVNSAYDKTRFTPNYVSALEAAKVNSPRDPVALTRWRTFPLSVYFVRDKAYTSARQALVVEGFNRWVKATGDDGVTYRVTSNASAADITVLFNDFDGSSNVLGRTFSFYDSDSRFIRRGSREVEGVEREFAALIQIGVTGDRFNDLVTVTHEFGHALGINEHSPDRPDLMFFEGNDRFTGDITTADLNTLLTSYSGVFNKNSNARLAPDSGEIISSVIEEKKEERIKN